MRNRLATPGRSRARATCGRPDSFQDTSTRFPRSRSLRTASSASPSPALSQQHQHAFDGIRYLPVPPIKSAAATGGVTVVVHRGVTRICRRSCPLRKDPGFVAPTRIEDCKGELQVSSPAASLAYSFPTRRSCLVRKFARASFPRRQSAPREPEIVLQIFGSLRPWPFQSRLPSFRARLTTLKKRSPNSSSMVGLPSLEIASRSSSISSSTFSSAPEASSQSNPTRAALF